MYTETHLVLQTLCKEFPGNQQAKTELSRTSRRLEERANGEYSFGRFYKEAAKLCPPQLDVATFTGPVTVKPSAVGGRGLFTTAAIKAGELLLCEKAFAYAFAYDENEQLNRDVTYVIDPHANSVTMGTQVELVRMIVQKIY